VEKGEKKIFTRYLGFSHFSLFVQSGRGLLLGCLQKLCTRTIIIIIIRQWE